MGRKITLIFIITALLGGILIVFRLGDCRQTPEKGRVEAAQEVTVTIKNSLFLPELKEPKAEKLKILQDVHSLKR